MQEPVLFGQSLGFRLNISNRILKSKKYNFGVIFIHWRKVSSNEKTADWSNLVQIFNHK